MLKSKKLPCEAEPVAAWFMCEKLLRAAEGDTAAMPIHGWREAEEGEDEDDGCPGKLKEL